VSGDFGRAKSETEIEADETEQTANLRYSFLKHG
jgi:hypothetical protein